MSILEIKEYLKLCLDGPKTIPERQKILLLKEEELNLKIKELQGSIDYIHWKQQFYYDVLSGKTKYFSNLIPTKNDD